MLKACAVIPHTPFPFYFVDKACRRQAGEELRVKSEKLRATLKGGSWATAFHLAILPGLDFVSGQTLDGLFRVGRFSSAVTIQEELAALGLVQGLFIALRIAEYAENFLLNQFGSVGIVLDLADNLLHLPLPFALCA